jgi:polysaccharide biosynthesis/export protein
MLCQNKLNISLLAIASAIVLIVSVTKRQHEFGMRNSPRPYSVHLSAGTSADLPQKTAALIQHAGGLELCSYQIPEACPHCGSLNGCSCHLNGAPPHSINPDSELPAKYMRGVDQDSTRFLNREPTWKDAECVPWETFAYGEYVGPHRTPHVAVYRLRVGDQVSFNYLLTRMRTANPYRIGVGDILQLTSGGDATIDRNNIQVLSDGTISLPLIGTVDAEGLTVSQLAESLNARYGEKYMKEPAITIQVVAGDIVIKDLRDAVDARAGQGGQNTEVEVMPDGTVRLPLIGAVPAVGLSLDEIAAEVNSRYALHVHGIFVTPNLIRRAPSVIYVLGQVTKPGRQELSGPTSLMQALATAENWQNGANLRQIIVFRRDHNWRLVATKLDIAGAVYGRNPHPADEIWLRHGDIVLVPQTPILRFSQAVDLYLRRTVYSIFPQNQLVFNFDTFRTF